MMKYDGPGNTSGRGHPEETGGELQIGNCPYGEP